MKKFSFLILSITFLFVVLPAISAACQVGSVNFSAGTFCTLDGTFAPLRIDKEVCTNDYECLNQSCIDGVCQVRYTGFGERGIWMQKILDYLNGIECDPRDQTLICQNGRGYICGANAVYEDKGAISPCTNSSNPDDGNNGGGGGGGGGSGINLLIISPRNITYNTAILSLEVVDRSRQAKYFSYSLDDGSDVVFSSPTSLSVSLGSHTLEVTGKRSASSSSKSTRSVTFTVLEEGASSCGDGICSSEETFSCAVDCGQQIDPFCNNNGLCEDVESSQTCPNDCPAAERDSKWGELLLIIILLIVAISVVTFLIIRKYHLLSHDTSVTATTLPKTSPPGSSSPMTSSVSAVQKSTTPIQPSSSSTNSTNPFSSEFGNI